MAVAPASKSAALSEEETAELYQVFSLFDTDGDGAIRADELKTVMSTVGVDMSDADVRQMIASADIDGEGTLSFSEFCTMMGNVRDDDKVEQQLKEVFTLFDVDRDDRISALDLAHALGVYASSRRPVTEQEAAAIIADVSPSGLPLQYFTFEDFCAAACLAARRTAPKDQPGAPGSASVLQRKGTRAQMAQGGMQRRASFAPLLRRSSMSGVDLKGKGGTEGRRLMEEAIAHLTDQQVAELRRVFELFDSDKSGFVSHSELATACASLGFTVDESELQEMLAEVDMDKSHNIDFTEFQFLMCSHFDDEQMHAQIEPLFDMFDQDGDGFLSVSDLTASLPRWSGQQFEDYEIAALVAGGEVDGKQEGRLTYEEFVELLCQGAAKERQRRPSFSAALGRGNSASFALNERSGSV